jgi:Asp-tRNA(Asn)/Glu-tRNA(Gln) amidotransferase A subunit family amidase
VPGDRQALALPVERDADGPPSGVQRIKRHGKENTLIAHAIGLEEALGGPLDPDAG